MPIGLDSFGASAPFKDVYKRVGLVGPVIAEKIKRTLDAYRGRQVVSQMRRPNLAFVTD